jgi:hypothetical protein
MPHVNPENLDLILLEDTIWVLVGAVDLPSYDFSLAQFFACRRPWNRPDRITAIGRFGVATNYDELYQQLAAKGIFLVHSPEQHLLASELPRWYHLLEGLTPKSFWFSEPPDIAFLEQTIGLPLFLKGSRQTSRHKASLLVNFLSLEPRRGTSSFSDRSRSSSASQSTVCSDRRCTDNNWGVGCDTTWKVNHEESSRYGL